MKKSHLILLSSVLTFIFCSGCSDVSEEELSPDNAQIEKTNSSELGATTSQKSALVKRANKIKSYLASAQLSTSQRALSQNTSLADVLYLLIEKEDKIDYSTIKTYALYNYFKENYVDTNKLSEEEKLSFSDESIERFNNDFVTDYFSYTNATEEKFVRADVHSYMQDVLDNSQEKKEEVLRTLFDIALDYPLMSKELSGLLRFIPYVSPTENKEKAKQREAIFASYKESFYQARVQNPNLESKFLVLLEKDPLVMSSIFKSMFNEKHTLYHRNHINTQMYTSMIDAMLKISGTYKGKNIADKLYGQDSFVLPNSEGLRENQDAFAKEFFNIGTTTRGDANELATEKLLMYWSVKGKVSPFELLNDYQYNNNVENIDGNTTATLDYPLYEYDEETKLAYLDFIYLGLVPNTDEADENQAFYFSYAREAGVNLYIDINEYNTINNSFIEDVSSQNFVKDYTLPVIKSVDAAERLLAVFKVIPFNRYIPYLYQYIQGTYYYYGDENSENNTTMQSYISDTLSYLVDNTQADTSYYFDSKQRSGASFSGYLLILSNVLGQLSELSFSDQVSYLIDYITGGDKVSTYFTDKKFPKPDENLISGKDLNLSEFVENANDDWLHYVNNGAYTNLKLYNDNITWNYLPPRLSNLKYIELNDASKNFDYKFNFKAGKLTLHIISTETASQLLEYGFDIKYVGKGGILSEDENQVYNSYELTISADENKTVNFSQLFEHIDAMFMQTYYIYSEK